MCTALKFIKEMRNYFLLFLLFLLFTTGSVYCQNNIPETIKNTETNSQTNENSILIKENDTLQIIEISTESKSVNKKSKEISKDKNVTGSAYDSKLEESAKPESVNAASSSFSLTKTQSSSQRSQRSPSMEQQEQMNLVVDQLEENSPESFEYNYFKYVAGNYNIDLIDNLKKAEAIRPANSDVQIQLAAYYLILKDTVNALNYLEKLEVSTRLNKDVIEYAEDLLLCTPENGTLITHGFDDSYATAYVQLSKKIRTDVKLISLDFLQSEKYKENLKSEGFVLPSRTVIDIQYFQEFCTKNAFKNIGISMTTPKEYLTAIQQNLFVVGLIFEYRTDLTFNNFYKNDFLWNEVLSKSLVNNATNEKAKQLSANYLPMLLHLRKVYEQTNEAEKVKEIDKAMDKVAVQCKKYDQVQKLKSSY